MSETEKPRKKPGSICPLHRKDVSKVCHKCELYCSVTVARPETPGEHYLHWGCSFNLAVMISRDAGAGIAGVQAAVESLRNEVNNQHLRMLAESGGGGPPQFAPVHNPKKIEG